MENYTERQLSVLDGWLFIIILFLIGTMGYFTLWNPVFMAIYVFIFILGLPGFFILQPNEATVCTLFGKYSGTHKTAGFYWTNPFNKKQKISIKIQNLSTQQLKVNDKSGNPIEVSAIFVWRVEDTAKAIFGVENYLIFLKNQTESALRKVISNYYYDSENENQHTLKNNADEVSKSLKENLIKIIDFSGINILDAKLNHLAYAPEIAHAMLKKQQAHAVILARKIVVDGAVNMVEDVLEQMEEKNLADFKNDDKIKLITNLMTVLVGDNSPTPVIQIEK